MNSIPIFDFREGSLMNKTIYTDRSFDLKSNLLYYVVLLCCWAWGLAWFTLFYSFLFYYENIAYIVYIIIFVVHFIIIITVGAKNITGSRKKKQKLRLLKAKQQEQELRIEQARKLKATKARSKKASTKNLGHIQQETEKNEFINNNYNGELVDNNNGDKRLNTEMQSLK